MNQNIKQILTNYVRSIQRNTKKFLQVKQEFIDNIKTDELRCLNIAYDTSDIKDIASTIKQKFKKIFIIGVDGLALGSKSLLLN